MSELSLWIPGKPIALARPRARVLKRSGCKPIPVLYHPQEKELEAYRRALLSRCPVGHTAYVGALELHVRFFFEVAKSETKTAREEKIGGTIPHISKPDTSNLLKWVEDAANGVLWQDDRQVTKVTASKHYGMESGTELKVREL